MPEMFKRGRGSAYYQTMAAAVAGLALATATATAARGSDLDTVGVTQLRAVRPDLIGTGVTVAQPEATTYNNPNDPNGTMPYDPQFDADDFAVNPAVNTGVGITYVNKLGGVSTNFSTEHESGHADGVATNLLGLNSGAAPGVTLVNYNVNYFVDTVIFGPGAIQTPVVPVGAAPVRVVNQSFIFTNLGADDRAAAEQLYDDYVATNNMVIATAVGNSGGIQVPATAYNVISVGDTNGGTSVGPTSDGRSKPDISAPGGETSFSTPYVSGIAAILIQAAASGAGGTSAQLEAAAGNHLMVKALLMNGATKPPGWTHTSIAPLDPTYGAGIVNAFNSYENMAAGRKLPTAITGDVATVSGSTTTSAGWDLNTLTTTRTTNAVAHYLLNLAGDAVFTGTLTWDRPAGTVTDDSIESTTINQFDLLLYNVVNGSLIESISAVDNVQYLYTADLPAGIYDLEVMKEGADAESATDTYALAFNAQLLNATMKAVNGGAAESGGGGTAVPEPGTLGVMGFAAMAAGWRGKRRRRVDRFPAGFVGSGRRTSRMICHGRGGSL